MKRNVIAILILSGVLSICSCNGNKKAQTDQTATSQPTTNDNSARQSSAETKIYAVTASPDTILLGKNKEAFIKLMDMQAIELSNPDGTSSGIELSYKIELTNKNAIGGSAVGLATTDFRLELDNGNKLAPNSIFVNAEPEATKLSDKDKFTIPAGAKPTALHLFYDQTRANVKIEIK